MLTPSDTDIQTLHSVSLYKYKSSVVDISPSVEKEIKIKVRSFVGSEHINEKRDGPYRGFGYLSLFSDPIDLATWSQR